MQRACVVAGTTTVCVLFALTASAQQKSLCDRLGGPSAVSAVVSNFAGKALKDDRINKKFAKSDANRIVVHLTQFVEVGTKCSGAKYEGRSMKATHEHMDVTDGEFSALVDDLVKTLDEFKVPAAEKTELLNILGGYKKDIVEKAGDTKTETELPANFKPAPPLKK